MSDPLNDAVIPIVEQCKVPVQINLGVGYYVHDVYPATYYCLRHAGHDGAHIIAERNPEDDDL